MTVVRPFGQQILVVLLFVFLSTAMASLLVGILPKWATWLVAAIVVIGVDALLLIFTSSVRKSARRVGPR